MTVLVVTNDFPPRIGGIELVPLRDRHDAIGIVRHHPLHRLERREIWQVRARSRYQAFQILRSRHEDDEMTGHTIDPDRAEVMSLPPGDLRRGKLIRLPGHEL